MTVLTTYLGRGLSSRLFKELREKRGLCYAVATDESRWTDTGIWTVYAGLALDRLEEAVGAIGGEIGRLKEVEITAEDLEQAKEKIRGPLLLGAEDPINVMNFYAKQVLDKPEEMQTYDQVIDSVMRIDISDVRLIAQNLFAKDRLDFGSGGAGGRGKGAKVSGKD